MEVLNIKKKLKSNIAHQGIGGKEIILEFEITPIDTVLEESISGNWACYNFIQRRKDFNYKFPYKVYYGKVNGLGYVVSEDEFEEEEEI